MQKSCCSARSVLPLAAFTLTTMVTVALAAAFIVPRLQVTVAADTEHDPALAVTDVNFSPARPFAWVLPSGREFAGRVQDVPQPVPVHQGH